jgi:chromosome partitioning protein
VNLVQLISTRGHRRAPARYREVDISNGLFNLKKTLQVFGTTPEVLTARGVDEKSLPPFARSLADQRPLKSWTLQELPEVGKQLGFMQKPRSPLAVSIFVTKGGVLKSTFTMNFARLAALHGIRTCVVGLDMQGDITSALSPEDVSEDGEDDSSLQDALAKVSSLRGLADVFTGSAELKDVLLSTDIPTLSYIPETPELVALDQSLMNRNRREYWLRDFVVKPLKEHFDLVIMDCSPNWNRLITNALVANDVLISPLECKINNFRNFKTFRALLKEFKLDMGNEFKQLFVPTRVVANRKLSREILEWYQTQLPDCSHGSIRESLQGEESMAMRMSIPEYAPTSAAADEMRTLVSEVWTSIAKPLEKSNRTSTPFSRKEDSCLSDSVI